MFASCCQTADVLCSSLDECSLIQGQSDIIVIKHKSGQYNSTKLYICIGSYSSLTSKITASINNTPITQINFFINSHGYLQPSQLTSKQWQQLNLKYGKNTAQFRFELKNEEIITLSCQVYLYSENDRLVISDVDGTLTKNDVGGLVNNYLGNNYLHDGYHQLVNGIVGNGYKVVWLTMRSLPMYNFSKDYIRKHVPIQGPLLMEPQQFFHAVKKQLTRATSKIKTNIMLTIKQAYPKQVKNPLIGGLGNRQGDAIAYGLVGIPHENIYIIDTNSEVHKLDNKEHELTYQQILKQIKTHFPPYNSMNVGILTKGYSKYNQYKQIKGDSR